MKRVLIITTHRKDRAPGQRFRFEQYLNYLNENGFEVKLSFILDENTDEIFFSSGNPIRKGLIFIRTFIKRINEARSNQHWDIVFIFREAHMFGSIFIEKLWKIKHPKTKFVFDFDDSIWLKDVSEANKYFSWLKNPAKTAKIIGLADLVFAGNQFLAEYASKYNNNVKIIPTTIDTNEYVRIVDKTKTKKICIGWSGSITTIKHFEYALPFLAKLKQKYDDGIYFKVIGDGNYIHESLGIHGVPWNKECEIKELSEIDIGIMPLPNDEWAQGKCGLKGLQYMALEIPTIMSPVGVNTEIINDGLNGYLANTIDEWVEKLSLLINSSELRERIGKEARQTVMERFSVESQKSMYLNYFNEVLNI